MIITLLSFGILLVGFCLFCFLDRAYELNKIALRKGKKKLHFFLHKLSHSSSADAFVATMIIAGIIGGMICSFFIGINSVNKQVDYEHALYTKKTIEYRIEHKDDNIIGNEMLYNDITEFNNELRSTKYWANNPWTSWFNNEKVAQLDYIEYEFAEG